MPEEKKVAEITVLTVEQINALPETVKENVTFLTEKLGGAELITLNPIVVELLEIKELNDALILMPKNADGEFNKDNIVQYKALKSKARSFNAKIKESAKTLKVEPAKITKGIIAIEKAFLSENKTVQDSAAEKFADYEAEVIEKARIAKEKKDKALLDKIAEETKLKEEANLGLNRTNVYNKVKYELINKQYVEDVSDAVANSNGAKLGELRTALSETDYDGLLMGVDGADISILEQDVNAELKEYWISSRAKALGSIDARLEAIRIENENIVLQAKNETITETVNKTAEALGNAIENKTVEPAFPITNAKNNNYPSGPSIPPPPMFATIEACIANIEYNEFASEDGRSLNESRAWLKLKDLISKA